jgi:predicted aspartyl protease
VKNKAAVLFALGISFFTFLCFRVRAKESSAFIKIPFELKSGYIVFSVPTESSGLLTLLFDTGCQTLTLRKDPRVNPDRKQSIAIVFGQRKLIIDNYHINQSSRLSKRLNQKIDGVIGNDILHRYTVQIDYKEKKISLYDREGFVNYPHGDDVRIEVNSLVSSIQLTITLPGGKQIEGEFMIDTGAPINLLINSPVAEKYGLYMSMKMDKKKEFRTLGDVQAAAAVMSKSVRIGDYKCDNVEIHISTSKKGLFATTRYAGIVGNAFLKNFNVIFDYHRKRLHLEKY